GRRDQEQRAAARAGAGGAAAAESRPASLPRQGSGSPLAWHPRREHGAPSAGGPSPAPSGFLWRMATGVAVVVAIASIAAALASRRRETPKDLQEIRFEVTTTPTDDPAVSLSADGMTLA